jgi:hypothetical protein
MPNRSTYFAGLVAATAMLAPSVAQADVRIEERSSTLNSNFTRWISVKGERRAIVTKADLEVGGALFNAGAKYGAYVEIARPDQELIWELDPQERTYKVVKAEQFSRLLQKGIQAPRNPNEQPLRTLYRSETTAIEVVPTGKTKRIAGLTAEEVKARVVVGAQNLINGKQLVFTFDQEIWITKDERLVKETREFEQAYAETFGSAASLSQAQLMAGEWNDAFITHLRAMGDRVRALGGFTMAMTTTVTEEAIAQSKNEKNNSRSFVVASMEVRRVTMDSIPENEFELPAGYIDQDTKVAVAPKTPELMPAGPAVVAQPKPMMPAVAVEPKPTMPSVAAEPKTMGTTPPSVVAQNPPSSATGPGTSAATAPPSVPAGPAVAVAPKPEFPVAIPGGPPTNILVPGGPVAPGATAPRPGRATPVLVQGYTPPAVANNYPVLQPYSLTTTKDAPAPVTIDEPVPDKKRKKR